jgi:7,8-dihydro-6-hydroxymethylpterin-pyrophosphokinase
VAKIQFKLLLPKTKWQNKAFLLSFFLAIEERAAKPNTSKEKIRIQ